MKLLIPFRKQGLRSVYPGFSVELFYKSGKGIWVGWASPPGKSQSRKEHQHARHNPFPSPGVLEPAWLIHPSVVHYLHLALRGELPDEDYLLLNPGCEGFDRMGGGHDTDEVLFRHDCLRFG